MGKKSELVAEILEITNCNAEQEKDVENAVAGFYEALRVRFLVSAGEHLERKIAEALDD